MRTKLKRLAAVLLSAALLAGGLGAVPAQAKTTSSASGENIFCYALNREGKSVLLKVIPVEELQAISHGQLSQLTAGTETGENYYVSSTDNYPTTQYCEARGITLPELVDYVKKVTTVSGAAALSFSGGDTMRFMATDSYGNYTKAWTYDQLYGQTRYYFPGLYDSKTGWNTGWEVAGTDSSKTGLTLAEYNAGYRASDPYYSDKRAVFQTGVATVPILATTSLSGRTTSSALVASTELGLSDYIAANGGTVTGCLKNALTDACSLRLCLPMTEADLMSAHRTAFDNFKWIYNIRLDMENAPALVSKGTVAQPVASVTQSGDKVTITLTCSTPGASIYYSYDGAPQTLYTGPITYDAAGQDLTASPLTFYATAVKEGYDDGGIVTMKYPGLSPAFQTVYSAPTGSDLTFTADSSVTQAEWTAWTGALTSITLKTPSVNGYVKVDSGKYTIDNRAKTITFDQSLFSGTGSYSFLFHAAKYADKGVSVTLKGGLPTVSADGTYALGSAVTLTFDDQSYQEGLSLYLAPEGEKGTLISSSYLDRTVAGQVTIKASYFALASCPVTGAGRYVLTLVNSKYQPNSQEVPLTFGKGFSDVAADAWYAGAVDYVVGCGLFGGTSATTFEPDYTMTRAMFVTVMSNVDGVDTSGYTTGSFRDVASSDWYATRVNWAASVGLVAGTGDGQFSPKRALTLEQMLLILYQHSGDPASTADLPTQVGAMDSWAEPGLRWANEKGLLNGVEGPLSARGSANRAQVAQILMNYCQMTEG